MSPPPLTSQTDEGSNQSSSTHLSEDGIEDEAMDDDDDDDFLSPPSTIAEEDDDLEEFDFDKQPPVKCPLIDEDLGPPIKPTGTISLFTMEDRSHDVTGVAIDFTKPSMWEDEVNSRGIGKSCQMTPTAAAATDERTHTMQYLMSNTDLLAEVLKQMESGSGTSIESAVASVPSIPDATSKSMSTKNSTAAKKKRKRKSKAGNNSGTSKKQ